MTALHRLRTALLIALLAGAGQACTLLPSDAPHAVYRLPPPEIPAAEGEPVGWTLRLNRPSTHDVLAGNRIAVAPDERRLGVLPGARWPAPVPVLWRDRLREAFQADGRVPRVAADGERTAADWTLAGTLHAFQVERRGEARAQAAIRFDAQLLTADGRRIVATRRFSAERQLAGDGAAAAAAALGEASDAVAAALIDWTLSRVAAHGEEGH